MKRLLSKSFEPDAKNVAELLLVVFNVTAIVYIAVCAAIPSSGNAANAFAFIFALTVLFDAVFAAATKRKWGFYLLAGIALCLLLDYLGLYLVTLSAFESSVSGLSIAALLLIPIASILLLSADLIGIEERAPKFPKLRKIAAFILKPALTIGLLVIAILGYDAVYNLGESVHAYTTTRAGILFIMVAAILVLMVLSLTLRTGERGLIETLKREFAFILIAATVGGLAIGFFSKANGSIDRDFKAGKAAYAKAFSDEIFSVNDGMMAETPFSLSAYFLGIPTKNYTIRRNIVYTERGVTESGNLLKLSFDVYLPDPSIEVGSVLISIHGRHGDKDTGNYAQKHKYFASRGYHVFDLQVGDYDEADTNFPAGDYASYPNMSENVLLFLEYLKENNDFGANLESVFLTGGSMGGTITMIAGVSMEQRVKELGIGLKGLIPYYPAYYSRTDGVENFVNNVTETTPPALLILGENDGTVDMRIIEYLDEAYADCGNGKFAGIWISSAGHGLDGMFTGRGGQLSNYFAERFMAQFR